MESGRGLLEVARERMRARHLAYRTEQAYLDWIRRYIAFHKRRHPRDLGAAEVEQFLTMPSSAAIPGRHDRLHRAELHPGSNQSAACDRALRVCLF